MLGINFQFVDQFPKVEKAAADATFKNIGHAAATIRKDDIASIIAAPGPSDPGTPPHTRAAVVRSGKNKGKQRKGQLQRAIAYDVTKDSAIIGARFSVVGTSDEAHEFGGEYKGEFYPARPSIGPALDKNTSRFADSFAGSIGG